MTKSVRIENADNSDFVVLVETWEKGRDGEPDQRISTQKLGYPTAMTDSNTFITSSRYIVIKEASKE